VNEETVLGPTENESLSGIQMALKHAEALEPGVWLCTRWKLGFRIGQYTTVFKAEVHAIKVCVVENLNRNYTDRKIYILSDSQAVIKALSNHWITSKLVWDCHRSHIQLAEHNRVQLIWVPGHEDTDGNEMTVQLAKLGSV
jgi:ribonuclease HI